MADLTSFTSSLFWGDGGGEREKPRQWGWEVAVEFGFPCMGVVGEGLLPEVSWDLVNILNHTRRGLCESWDFKIIS